jgi:O-antigen/teichoic acid export membrane protein
LLNAWLARSLSPESYGAFAVAFAGFLFVSGFHNVIFVEPMTVIGPSSYSERISDYMHAQLRGNLIIVCVVAGLALAAGAFLSLSGSRGPLVNAISAAGVGAPLILIFWLTRRMCYVVQNPLISAQGSALYLALLFAGILGLQRFGRLGPGTGFLLMGGAGTVASVFIFRRLGLPLSVLTANSSPSLRQVLSENWTYGRWLTLTTILSWVSLQAQTFLAAGILGLSTAGVLRAMQLPSLAMTQVIVATTLMLLPTLSAELGRGNLERLRQKAVLASVCLAGLGLVFAIGLFLTAGPVERLLFGGRYASTAWLIPVLGLAPVFAGLSAGLSLALRTLGKSEFELLAYVLSSVASLGSALVLMPKWGLPGAVASIVGSTAFLAIAVLGCFLKWGRGSAANVRELQVEEAL